MNSHVIRLCERISLVLGALALSAGAGMGRPPVFLWALLAGFLLAFVNLVGMRWLLGRIVVRLQHQYALEQAENINQHINQAAEKSANTDPTLNPDALGARPAPGVMGLLSLLIFKILAALGVVWLVLTVWKLDPIGFGLGLSLVAGTLLVVPFVVSTSLPEAKRVAAFESVPTRASAPSTPPLTDPHQDRG